MAPVTLLLWGKSGILSRFAAPFYVSLRCVEVEGIAPHAAGEGVFARTALQRVEACAAVEKSLPPPPLRKSSPPPP